MKRFLEDASGPLDGRFELHDLGPAAVAATPPAAGRDHVIEKIGGQLVLLSDEVDGLLGASRSPLAIVAEPFRLSRPALDFRDYVLAERSRGGAELFNAKKVRLAQDLVLDALRAGATVAVQPTDYFAGPCRRLQRMRDPAVGAGSGPPLSI